MYRKDIANIGVGINYRVENSKDILDHIPEIDFVEVYTGKFFKIKEDPVLSEILSQIPLVLHGLDFSIGSDAYQIDPDYQLKLASVLEHVNFRWFSEHIAITKEKNDELNNLVPISFSSEIADRIISKVRMILNMSNHPFLLENIVYYPTPNGDLSEYQFIKKILEESDCGMLLDLNNVYINSKNHKYDPYEFIKKLPLERVVEIHMAGGASSNGTLIDTHSDSIPEEVWKLFSYTCKIAPVRGVAIERESNLEQLSDLLAEVKMARSILAKN